MQTALALLVEGHGDRIAVPILVRRLLAERQASAHLVIGTEAIRVGCVTGLAGEDRGRNEWLRLLRAAGKNRRTTAILAVLDGDVDRREGKPFCVATIARTLAQRAREAGAGTQFSLACVFAAREFETWLIAGVESLAGRSLPDGRAGVKPGVRRPPLGPDDRRDPGKRWLAEHMTHGYKETQDQGLLAELVDLAAIRAANRRSFRRLERAVDQLAQAARTGNPIVSPD